MMTSTSDTIPASVNSATPVAVSSTGNSGSSIATTTAAVAVTVTATATASQSVKTSRLYMVIERFCGPGEENDSKACSVKEIYSRFRECGRMMPDDLKYVSSYIDESLLRCFQIMEANVESHEAAMELFKQWHSNWR
jgi:Domain of unknown function (DUF3303)